MQLMADIGTPGCPFEKPFPKVIRAQVLILMVEGNLGMSKLLILIDTRHTSSGRQTWLQLSVGPHTYTWPYAVPCHALPCLCLSCSTLHCCPCCEKDQQAHLASVRVIFMRNAIPAVLLEVLQRAKFDV